MPNTRAPSAYWKRTADFPPRLPILPVVGMHILPTLLSPYPHYLLTPSCATTIPQAADVYAPGRGPEVRNTLEQEYREALINARLAQAWAAGERWARCDLYGLPAVRGCERSTVCSGRGTGVAGHGGRCELRRLVLARGQLRCGKGMETGFWWLTLCEAWGLVRGRVKDGPLRQRKRWRGSEGSKGPCIMSVRDSKG